MRLCYTLYLVRTVHGGGTLTSYVLAMVQTSTRTQVRYLTCMQDMRLLVWYPRSESRLVFPESWKSDLGDGILGYRLMTSTRATTHDALSMFVAGWRRSHESASVDPSAGEEVLWIFLETN